MIPGQRKDSDTVAFEQERTRLTRMAEQLLREPTEAEDIVQQAWIRWHRTDAEIENLAGWLTTVTVRLCLDRLRSRTPLPQEEIEIAVAAADPAEEVLVAVDVGIALQVVLDRLTPTERVAFVLHDSFAVDFATIAEMLATTPAATRKLASRARGKVGAPVDQPADQLVAQPADWQVVDAFLAAARGGGFSRLMEMLAPDVVVAGDEAAIATGTPARLDGQRAVAEMFNGAAKSALPVFVDERPGAAWFDRGVARVAFDFAVRDGLVHRIDFRADADVLTRLRRRQGKDCSAVTPAARRSSST